MGGEDGGEAGLPVHPVRLSGFWMDEHEVTREAYERFCAETGRDPPAARPDASPLEPVLVRWDEAAAYCAHYGKRLPTEAEFERVYRGDGPRARFPWGDESTPPRLVGNLPDRTLAQRMKEDGYPPIALASIFEEYDDGWAALAPVKSFPADAFGLHDIVGNAWEWCSDWYADDWYWRSPEVDPAGPASPGLRFSGASGGGVRPLHVLKSPAWRVIRGGGFDGVRDHFPCAVRTSGYENHPAGFRGVVSAGLAGDP